MARLPFDPGRAAGPGSPEADDGGAERPELGPAHRERRKFGHLAESQQLSVSQVSELIKSTLEQRIASPLRVRGEVSNLNTRNHWYFCLKDEAAVLQCVAWATAARKFNFSPKDGDEVVATGHVSHYGPQGRTQFYVSALEPLGTGQLDARFRALCEQLRAAGYFEEGRKKKLPLLPRRIAVITSETGAALQDVLATARQRCPAVGILLADVRVQGDGAAEDVARTIRWVDRNAAKLGVDAMLVTRGGGSIEDLWAFNERIVADTVFRCRVPVVAAIGHESDLTIIELVADVRASTPTQAVMRLVPAREDLARQAQHLSHRLGMLMSRWLDREQRRLRHMVEREFFRDPTRLIRPAAERLRRACDGLPRAGMMRLAHERLRLQRLTAVLPRLQSGAWLAARHARAAVLSDRLERAIRLRLDDRPRLRTLQNRLAMNMKAFVRGHQERLEANRRHLAAMDPHGVLNRGYSITTDREGNLVRSAATASIGKTVVTRVADGSFESVVSAATRPARGRKRAAGVRLERPSTPGLFDFVGELSQTDGAS